ncbi:hypothetical protein ANANG_G00027410 [Anguilla anguilla]|uniref:SRCR domain-containing protein n=1 Tax=Anguilla anguilla TaxID=7936 RepID=A0A9D3MUH4_ANGAN|nr:hypothetical protein ANANG_G00027410 [Anguilla anguilla]
MDVQVVCRQLGCGSAAKAHGNATFGTGNSTLWLTEVNCRGTEMHLWDCPHSVHQHSRCPHQNQAGVTCTVVSTQPVPRLKEAPPSPSIPAVAFLVMGALLFLLLAVLGVLLFQNRALRRALSQWDNAPLHEAVYEEIEYKLAGGGTYSAPRRGSGLSEDPPSGYEDVGDSEGHSLSVLRFSHKSPEVSLLSGDLVMEVTPENYDDVSTADKHPDSVPGELVEGDAPEHYDDVITMQPGPDAFPGESVLAETPPAPSGMDYDDVGEEPPERGGAL